MAVLGLGRSNIACSRVSEAAAYVERAGALLSAVEDPPGVALTLLYSGLVALFTDQLEAACELFGRCAAMCRELGFQPLGARALQLLGIARLDLGDLKAARAALEVGTAGRRRDRRPLGHPDRAVRLRRARGQDRQAPAGSPAGRRC